MVSSSINSSHGYSLTVIAALTVQDNNTRNSSYSLPVALLLLTTVINAIVSCCITIYIYIYLFLLGDHGKKEKGNAKIVILNIHFLLKSSFKIKII